ncbi:MAG: SDR family NAD(P)-dependent oxidoreductase [Chloroflexota bacterium]|nr:MAG: SDR family NAD(P)-dependent oxidoreductase [Chloroflexota bacterium]
MTELAGKIAVVTGSSRGIGKAIALGLAQRGCRVVVAARSEAPGKRMGTISSTAEEIRTLGGEALPVGCDVSDEVSVQEMVQTVVQHWGAIDILINNAGIGIYGPFLEIPTKLWDRIMAVNVRGTFLCSKAIAPIMIDHGRGSIINISSTAANTVFSLTSPKEEMDRTLVGVAYGASKAAVERMTIGLAAEFGRCNIAVNAVKPGRTVRTETLQQLLPNSDWSAWVSPNRMVVATAFLAGQDASGVTGVIATDDEIILRHGL